MDMKQLRERAQLKTIAVAYHVGIAESTVRNWEKGRTVPKLRIDQFRKLLNLYSCTFEELEAAIETTMAQKQSNSKKD